MIHAFTFNAFAENTYVIADSAGRAAIIDPGCQSPNEQAILVDFIVQHRLTPVMLLQTHCHIDHVLGNAFVHRTWGLKPRIHPKDLPDLQRLVTYAPIFGVEAEASPEPEAWLEHGETIHLGDMTLELREAPGHSAGSICFVNHHEGWVIGGDVLFAGSIGRTDLPGGNYERLLQSVKNQLFTLPDDYVLYSGHGPSTTIGHEKATNPFFVD